MILMLEALVCYTVFGFLLSLVVLVANPARRGALTLRELLTLAVTAPFTQPFDVVRGAWLLLRRLRSK